MTRQKRDKIINAIIDLILSLLYIGVGIWFFNKGSWVLLEFFNNLNK